MKLRKIFINKQRKYDLNLDFYEKIIDKFFEKKVFNFNKTRKRQIKNSEIIITICFVSSREIRNLKRELFGLNIVTDVISVPIDTNFEDAKENIPIIFGEVFICPSQADTQAKKFCNSFEKEMALLLVHGLLHLIGFCDNTENEKILMRKEEKIFLKLVYKLN